MPSLTNTTSMGNEVPVNGQRVRPPTQTRNIQLTSSGIRRRLSKSETARLARNIALAEYYQFKKKFIESKFDNILLENEKLRLEIKMLKEEDL